MSRSRKLWIPGIAQQRIPERLANQSVEFPVSQITLLFTACQSAGSTLRWEGCRVRHGRHTLKEYRLVSALFFALSQGPQATQKEHWTSVLSEERTMREDSLASDASLWAACVGMSRRCVNVVNPCNEAKRRGTTENWLGYAFISTRTIKSTSTCPFFFL